MRGKDHDGGGHIKTTAITPACAGKSDFLDIACVCHRDHPRVCGEKQENVSVDLIKIGITPACAGKSSVSCEYNSFYRDHPRVCGEKIAMK